jgi:hypothetical protein
MLLLYVCKICVTRVKTDGGRRSDCVVLESSDCGRRVLGNQATARPTGVTTWLCLHTKGDGSKQSVRRLVAVRAKELAQKDELLNDRQGGGGDDGFLARAACGAARPAGR